MLEVNVELGKVSRIGSLAACIGYFDGLHLGHQQLISKTIELANENGLASALITFEPDPWVVLRELTSIEHINSLAQRKTIVDNLGIDIWISIAFTKELANLKPDAFINDVLIALGVNELVCGFDFTFGSFGQGDTKLLGECHEFNTTVIDPVLKDEVKISSTLIEENIRKGNLSLVRELLSRPYTLISEVIHGRNRGEEIGFATANIDVNGTYVVPKTGVYAGVVNYDGEKYVSVVNVGHNPTFNERTNISIECHLLDFSGDLYGKTIEVEFYEFIRDERKFDNVEALTYQIKKDIEKARGFSSFW
jgi:riboflavin kinase/FMN adenylyltransferase